MSYAIDWYIENRVIYGRLWNRIAEEDIQTYAAQVRALVAQGEPPIHIILDDSDLIDDHVTLGRVRAFSDHPDVGWVVLAGELDRAANLGEGLLARLLRLRSRRVPTVEDAIAFLRERDPGVDWDSASESVLANP